MLTQYLNLGLMIKTGTTEQVYVFFNCKVRVNQPMKNRTCKVLGFSTKLTKKSGLL